MAIGGMLVTLTVRVHLSVTVGMIIATEEGERGFALELQLCCMILIRLMFLKKQKKMDFMLTF